MSALLLFFFLMFDHYWDLKFHLYFFKLQLSYNFLTISIPRPIIYYLFLYLYFSCVCTDIPS